MKTEQNKIETLVVPSGIGDNLWVLQTLDPSKKYNFEICAGQPERGKQIFDLVPSMVNSVVYSKTKKYPKDCTYQLNEHLESGKHISEFREDGFVNWNLPFVFSEENELKAYSILSKTDLNYTIGIYASSIKSNKALYGWNADKWYKLMQLIKEHAPNVKFVLIGASYDDLLDSGRFDAVCMDEKLSITIEVLLECDLVIGFQSGIPILSSYFETPTLMMFADKLKDMHNTFCRNDVFWQAMPFVSPKEIFNKLIERGWL
jgi:ADP-heptose:LPS heptosyltransferase